MVHYAPTVVPELVDAVQVTIMRFKATRPVIGVRHVRCWPAFVAILFASACTPPGASDKVMESRNRTEAADVIRYSGQDFQAAELLTLAQDSLVFPRRKSDLSADISRISSVVLLIDGSVVSLDPAEQELLIFRRENGLSSRLAESGEGPGSISGAFTVAPTSDGGAFVLDQANRRLNVFQGAVLVSTIPLAPEIPFQLRRGVGRLSSGHFVITSGGAFQNQGGKEPLAQPTSEVAVLDSLGQSTAQWSTLGVEVASVETSVRGVKAVSTEMVRLGRRPLSAVQRDLVVTGDGTGYRLEFRDANGGLRRVIEASIPRRALTSEIKAKAIETELVQSRLFVREQLADTAEYERLIREAPYSDSLASFDEIYGSPSGVLWVVDGIAPGDREWTATAFDSGGKLMGRLRGSTASTPIAFGIREVALMRIDAEGDKLIIIKRILGLSD